MAIQVLVPLPEKGFDCDTIRAFFNEIRPFGRNKSHFRGMKSLRDEIHLAAGDMDGFNFIQAFGLDFICAADFILATARISFQKGSVVADEQPHRAF